ncbi:MAG: hypothetical protein QOI10_643 [Solirubrobacterales bacterium]|nr:hypothetical protein [Solirubrobacterales bacterium]
MAAEGPAGRGAAVAGLRSVAGSSWIVLPIGVLIAIATWELLPLGVATGLDPSAVNGVNLAARLGLDQGTEFAWTYGPLGYLLEPSVAGDWTAALGVAYTALIRAALAVSLLWAARRSFGLAAGAVLTYAVCAITGAEAVPLSLAVVWALVALDPERPPWVPRLLAIGGGALAAVELLVKLNVGVEVLVVLAIAIAALPGPRLRALAEFAGSFVATAALLWLLTGQGLSNIDDFASAALQVLAGYSAAMGTEAGAVGWDWIAAAVLVPAALGATAWTTRGWERRARAGSLVVVAALCLFAVKQGFVRHDVGHMHAFVAALAAPPLALRWQGAERFAAAAAVVAIGLLGAPLTGRAERDLYRPVAAARDGFDQLRTGLDPGRRTELAVAQGAAARAEYALDPRTLALLRRGSVAVDPWETTAVWAYDLDWRPLPVFQSYQAYTADLDQLNADALAAADGPRLILRHLGPGGTATESIDGRYQPYDAPATTRTMLCDFRAVRTTERYQVLERAPDRCGPEAEVATLTGTYGEPIEVPRVGPDEALFARLRDLGPSGLGLLRTAVYKDVRRLIALDDRVHRLVPATAENGLLISAPAAADFPAPFALAPDPATITVAKQGGFGSGSDSFEVEFFKMGIER